MPSLNGTWLLARDPHNEGRDQRWYEMEMLPGEQAATVPGIIQQTYSTYHGVAWYARTFTPARLPYPSGRYLLRFWTVDYLADVWVNGVHVGAHEGGETPFTLDITAACQPDAINHLVVRVLNPTHEPIDGIVLNETPHRNKYVPFSNGGSWDYGGITEGVDLILAPAVRVEDIFVQPDWQTGRVHIQATVRNATEAVRTGHVQFTVAPATGGELLTANSVPGEFPPGDTLFETDLAVPSHRLWDLTDPYLYRAAVRVWSETDHAFDEGATRFGFRDFRLVNGYFRLNGRRIIVRSTHTGNHSPDGQVLPPASAPDLLRRDLVHAKATGFNMVRYISGVAHPYQLDMCDEIGLLAYEETLAGWLLADSPQMPERFDRSIRDMVLRDRNHPSVAMWGLLNETFDGPIFRHAVTALDVIRHLDMSRLALLSSGRWDCQLAIGSASNPGSTTWEHVWGGESPDATPSVCRWDLGYPGGYFAQVGDAHVYPSVPHTDKIIEFLRTLGQGTKPIFLSEYGIGSVMNVLRELRMYEHKGISPEAEDAALMRSMADKFVADWQRFGMDGVYAFPEDMLHESQRLHARQRLLGFDAIRSNPQICGYNLTGMLDHGMTGEGLWTFWREWKPGIVDALADGWAPVRWCLFVEPMHGYLGRPLTVEAVLANEDDLAPGEYPVTLRIMGPAGVAWEQHTIVCVPKPAPGEDGPLAISVFRGEVTLTGPVGVYEFAAAIERGGAPAGGRLKFRMADNNANSRRSMGQPVTAWNLDERVQNWLAGQGIVCRPFAEKASGAPQVILVGDPPSNDAATADNWRDLARRVAQGSVAVILAPAALRRGDDPTGWLPLPAGRKGKGYEFNDWLYHKETVAKAHPVFEGLGGAGIMDWDYYGPLISRYLFDGPETPSEVMAAAFALGYSCPGGYASGVQLAAYNFGAGKFVVNAFHVLENVATHPAADRLLLNLVHYAAEQTCATAAALPDDFASTLSTIGYD
jgi:hypothetical protein